MLICEDLKNYSFSESKLLGGDITILNAVAGRFLAVFQPDVVTVG